MKKRDIFLIVTGAIATGIGIGFGILNHKVNKDIDKINLDKFADDTSNETPRKYITLPETPKFSFKGKNKKVEIKEETTNIIEETIEEVGSQVDSFEVYFDNYFKCEVLSVYQDFISMFFDSEGMDSLKYVKNRDIFNVVGDFDYNYLKTSFREQYSNIKQIMTSEIYSLPMECLPINKYLEEIEKYEKMEICEEKVMGTLSYWAAINGSLGQGMLI